MNGDDQKIYDAILNLNKELVEIRTKQDERHKVNLKKLEILDTLPCESRGSMYKNFIDHIDQGKKWRIAIIGVSLSIFIQGFSFSNGYGALTTKVIMLERGFTKHIESYNLLLKKYINGKAVLEKN